MGKVQLFEIRLGESRVIYSPGEPLVGTVTVRLSGSLQYRGEPAACPAPAPRCPPPEPRPAPGTAGRKASGRGPGGAGGAPELPAGGSRGSRRCPLGAGARGAGGGGLRAGCPLCAGAAPLAPRPSDKLLCVFGGGWRGSNAKSLG